jgi:hypothetical protein
LTKRAGPSSKQKHFLRSDHKTEKSCLPPLPRMRSSSSSDRSATPPRNIITSPFLNARVAKTPTSMKLSGVRVTIGTLDDAV